MISLSPVLRMTVVFQRISHKRTSEASLLPLSEKNSGRFRKLKRKSEVSLPRERGTTKNTSFRVSCFAKSELRANACFSRPPREWRPENPWAPTFSTTGPVMRGLLLPSAARPALFTRSGARDSLFCLASEEGGATNRPLCRHVEHHRLGTRPISQPRISQTLRLSEPLSRQAISLLPS